MLKDQLSDTDGLADSPLILNKSQSMDSYNPNDQTNAMQKLFFFFRKKYRCSCRISKQKFLTSCYLTTF